jgi:hypothetical protein
MTQPYSVHTPTANSKHAIASAARLRSNGLIAINSRTVGNPEITIHLARNFGAARHSYVDSDGSLRQTRSFELSIIDCALVD